MLAAVLKEVREKKMSGPFEAPNHWATTMVASSEQDQSTLLQLPSGPVAAAIAFSSVTKGPGGLQGPPKIRREEDWHRSHHNSVVQTIDGPGHHTVDDVLTVGHFTFRLGFRAFWSWSHGHERAYRQFRETRACTPLAVHRF